jgi:hypothetical protein
MGMHLLGYENGIVGKLGRNAFLMILKVNYLAYAETNAS